MRVQLFHQPPDGDRHVMIDALDAEQPELPHVRKVADGWLRELDGGTVYVYAKPATVLDEPPPLYGIRIRNGRTQRARWDAKAKRWRWWTVARRRVPERLLRRALHERGRRIGRLTITASDLRHELHRLNGYRDRAVATWAALAEALALACERGWLERGRRGHFRVILVPEAG